MDVQINIQLTKMLIKALLTAMKNGKEPKPKFETTMAK